MKQSNSNRGMYIEKLVDNSAFYYFERNILLIEKKQVPFFFSKTSKNNITGSIKKSTTDYYGVYKGFYFDFEVKQTSNNFLLINQIKEHQMNYLKNVSKFGAISFLLIHFFMEDKIFAIKINDLINICKKSKRITLEYCRKNCQEARVIFPGVIDFEILIKNIIK